MPGADVSGAHEDQILGPDYAVALTEADMQPSLHAAEKKRISLADPLFARYFGLGTTDERSLAQPTLTRPSPLGGEGKGEGAARRGETGRSDIWSDAILIGLGGSDRRYFRVWSNHRTAVLMECRPDDPDYERHLVYTRFFESYGVPVPKLIANNDTRKMALFEDLGDTMLYSYLRMPRSRDRIRDMYRRVLDILVSLHARATDNVRDCPLLEARLFDYAYLRWETDYFLGSVRQRIAQGLLVVLTLEILG